MRYITLLILLVISSFSFATSIVVNGSVSGTWTADTVIVEGNLLVPSGNQLIISPGTLVRFNAYYRIDVMGSLMASGTAHDSILFTVRDTANFNDQAHGRGGWSGIRFRQVATSEDSSVFSYCRFQFSKATEDSLNSYGGCIFSENSHKIRFSNCLFYHNYSFYSGGAVYLGNSNARIERCQFKRNYSGNTGIIYGYGGGLCSKNSEPVIRWNKFYANSSTGVGGAASFEYSSPVFEHNIMEQNFSALGGALGILRSSPVNILSNNLVANNEAMFFGGGICCIRSFPIFSNLTISGNMSAYGGGFYCNDSASPSLYNSIIYENYGMGTSVYIWDVFSAPNFYYCNIEGDTTGFEGSGGQQGYHGEYFNNINADPDFAYSGMYEYQVWGTSPCIDAGTPDAGFLNLPPTDLAGTPRILNNRVDMGCYEYDGTTAITSNALSNSAINVFPNPFSTWLTIEITEIANRPAYLYISNSSGQVIKRISLGSNKSILTWDGCDNNGIPVERGIYFLSVSDSNKVYNAKVIK